MKIGNFNGLDLLKRSVFLTSSVLRAILFEIVFFILNTAWMTILTTLYVLLSPITLFISLEKIEKKEKEREKIIAEYAREFVTTTC